MTQVLLATVHAATLHDVLQRASRIAPTKGAAFDKAQGFNLIFTGTMWSHKPQLKVQATDLDVTFTEIIPLEEIVEDITLRLPSTILAAFVSSLPMDKDQLIRFHSNPDNGQIIVQYNKTRTKAILNPITGDFPVIPWFDYEELGEAQELASHIENIVWSTEDSGVLQGVRIDGEWLLAVSRARAARVKCPVAADEPCTALLSPVAQLIKGGTKIKMGVYDGKIVLGLDERTQITSVVLLGAWPNLVERLEGFDLPHRFKIAKQRWIDGLNRLLMFVRNDRLPRMTLTMHDGAMDMHLSSISGDVQDSCALSVFEGDDMTIYFNPMSMLEALNAFPGGTVTVRYGTNKQPFHLSDETSTYECWLIGFDPSSMP